MAASVRRDDSKSRDQKKKSESTNCNSDSSVLAKGSCSSPDIQRFIGPSLISNRLSNGKGSGRLFVGPAGTPPQGFPPLLPPADQTCLLNSVTGHPLIAWKGIGFPPASYLVTSTSPPAHPSPPSTSQAAPSGCNPLSSPPPYGPPAPVSRRRMDLRSLGVGLIAVETGGVPSRAPTTPPSNSPSSGSPTTSESVSCDIDCESPTDTEANNMESHQLIRSATAPVLQRKKKKKKLYGAMFYSPSHPPSYCYLSITRSEQASAEGGGRSRLGNGGIPKGHPDGSLVGLLDPTRLCQTFQDKNLSERRKRSTSKRVRAPLITISVPPNCQIIRNDDSVNLSTSYDASSDSGGSDEMSSGRSYRREEDSPVSLTHSDTGDDSSSLCSTEDFPVVNTVPPPERQWIWHNRFDRERPAAAFSVLCYNVLCDKYATASLYSYCPSWALNWEYRKNLIMKEIRHFNADIVSLQEVETEQYNTMFRPDLEAEGYQGIFSPKSRAKTMGQDERKYVDGCAVFWKTDKFELEKKDLIEFTQIAIDAAEGNEQMLNRVMTRDNIALAAVLKIKDHTITNFGPGVEALVGSPLVVSTAHIHWDPEFCDVKLVQTMMLAQKLEKLLEQVGERFRMDPKKVPMLICGDLNSLPNSGVYEYMAKGKISRDHVDFKHFRDVTTGAVLQKLTNIKKDESNHYFTDLKLESAYTDNVMPFTNYTLDFKGIIDYIFATPQSLTKLGVLGPLDASWIGQNKIIGFPHPHIPSDHIPLLVQYSINTPQPQQQQQHSHQQQQQQQAHLNRAGSSGYFHHPSSQHGSSASLNHHISSLNHFQPQHLGGWS